MTDPHLERDSQARLSSRYGRSFVPGELLFSDGDRATEAYLLEEGRVRVIKRVGATERNLRLLRPGDLFGESALVAASTRRSTAVAATAGTMLVFDQRTLEQVLAADPAIGMRVMQQLARRLGDAEDQIEVLMLGDSRSKIVVMLLKLAAQQAPGPLVSGDSGSAELTVSPMDLSTRVGLDLDTVKRTVQQLKESGHLHIAGERIAIPNVASLRELSNLLTLRDQIVGMPREPSNRRARSDG